MDWKRTSLVAAGIALTTVGHYLTPPDLVLWHSIFQRLYYLPIVYAGICFGLRGGLLAAVASGLCYTPFIVAIWGESAYYSLDKYPELILFLLVGTVTGVLSDREKKRENELRDAAEQLAKVNRELQDSFERLRRADRLSAVGQLSAGLAHEIRNPLASIEGAARVLQKGDAAEDLKHEFLGIIQKECRRLNRLLTDLLDFARPRLPERRDVNIAGIIESVINLAGHSAGKNHVTITNCVPQNLHLLRCDPEQISQVLLNLVINGIQSMPDGGEILLSANHRGQNLVIQVRDQGMGVPSENLNQIFDPFYTTKDDGTGLGLSVANQIVAQHGGSISAERNADRGMTFSVVLPLSPKEAP